MFWAATSEALKLTPQDFEPWSSNGFLFLVFLEIETKSLRSEANRRPFLLMIVLGELVKGVIQELDDSLLTRCRWRMEELSGWVGLFVSYEWDIAKALQQQSNKKWKLKDGLTVWLPLWERWIWSVEVNGGENNDRYPSSHLPGIFFDGVYPFPVFLAASPRWFSLTTSSFTSTL